MVDRRGQIFLPKNRLCSCQNGFPLFFHCKLYFKTLNLQQCLILSWTLCRNTKFYMLSKNKTGFETYGSVVNLNLFFFTDVCLSSSIFSIGFFQIHAEKTDGLIWFWFELVLTTCKKQKISIYKHLTSNKVYTQAFKKALWKTFSGDF